MLVCENAPIVNKNAVNVISFSLFEFKRVMYITNC